MEKFSRLILDLYSAAHDCNLVEFDSEALVLTKQVVGFDSAAVMGITYSPKSDVKVQSIHLHNQPIEKFHERKNFKNDDSLLTKAFRNKGRSIIADASVDNRDKPDILQYCKKYGVAHGLTLIDVGATGLNLDTIALWRARPKDAYTTADGKISELVIPHLFKARAINQKIHMQNDSNVLQRISLLSCFDGSLQFVDGPTIEVLTAEWPHWVPPLLPTAFMEALRCSSARQYVGRTFIANCTVHDRFLFIQLNLLPKRQNFLTKAETSAALLAARGLSYKEIAKELGTSPATVRNQLHSTYLKLGVTNKTSLAQRLADQPEMIRPLLP